MKTRNKIYFLLFFSLYFNNINAFEIEDFDNQKKQIVYLASFFPRNVFLSSSRFGSMNTKKQSLKKYLKYTPQYKNLLKLINEIDVTFTNDSENKLIDTYWRIGELINAFIKQYKKSKNFDKYLINQLTIDSKFDKKSFNFMIEFNKLFFTYSHEITLEHYKTLVSIENSLQRKFYYKMSVLKNLDFIKLNNAINDKVFEKNDEYENNHIFETYINEFTPNSNDNNFFFNESSLILQDTEKKII